MREKRKIQKVYKTLSRAEKREREKKLNKIEETRRGKRSERNIKQKGRKGNPKVKVMSDRRKAFIKKANALFVLVYLVFCIYRISAYFSFRDCAVKPCSFANSVEFITKLQMLMAAF